MGYVFRSVSLVLEVLFRSSCIKALFCSSDPEMASLVSMVRDVLPHLDPDYITSCLLHFDKDCERTIHALLEGSVPELIEVQQNSANDSIQNESEQNSGPSNLSLVDTRRNVYDNDEFDIGKNQNLDLSKIHKGKRNTVSILTLLIHLIFCSRGCHSGPVILFTASGYWQKSYA